MEEVWKDIFGFEDLYQVSNLGRVKSLGNNKTRKERIIKLCRNNDGYFFVCLHKDGKRFNKLVHRLVAQHFIPNDVLFKTDINHKDENKENNQVDNLEWVDHKTNINYGTRNERSAKARTNYPSLSKPIIQYSLDGTFIKEFPSTNEAEREFGFNHRLISECCNGKRQTHKGYIWRYKNSLN